MKSMKVVPSQTSIPDLSLDRRKRRVSLRAAGCGRARPDGPTVVVVCQ
jgi:hypothetical protein